MFHWLRNMHRLFADLREREAAQRNFMRAVYEQPSRFPADYQRPAYQRRARTAVFS